MRSDSPTPRFSIWVTRANREKRSNNLPPNGGSHISSM